MTVVEDQCETNKNFLANRGKPKALDLAHFERVKLLYKQSFSCSKDERICASDVFNTETLDVRL